MDKFKEYFSLKSILVSNEPTFHHNNQTAVSQIDHILFYIPPNSHAEISFLDHLCQLENSSNISSHDVIVGNLKIPEIETVNSKIDFSNTYQPFLVKKPLWDESGKENYQKQTHDILNNLFETFDGPEFVPALSEMFSKMLVISAE